MRGIDTPVRKMRREIFKEIAQLAYHSDNLNDDVEALPYKIVNPETPIYRESIYREREIVREQIRLAMGLSLRPEDAPVHVTQGLEESNIDEKYYESTSGRIPIRGPPRPLPNTISVFFS